LAKIYVCRNFFPDLPEVLTRGNEVDVWTGEKEMPEEELIARIGDLDGVITCANHVTPEVFDAAKKLRVISNLGDGCDNIDLAEATRRGIPVGHTPDVLTETTADLAFGLLITTARRIIEGQAFARDGRWKRHAHLDLPGVDVNNKTLGIVGLGKIGSHIAKRAKAFNMRVLYYNRRRHLQEESMVGAEYRPSLQELLPECDFVLLATPLTAATRNLMSWNEFKLMKPTSILINVARGPVVDDEALYDALKTGKILRAALDVTSSEPLPLSSPLFTLDNIVIMPHIGSAVPETRWKMWMMAVNQLLIGLRGERIPNCINAEVYDQMS
jgi:glyoxylate reductase